MKNLLFFSFIFLFFASNAAIIIMPEIEAKLFIDEPNQDFNSIYLQDESQVLKAVKFLFDNDKLDHSGTRAYDVKATFEAYWGAVKNDWHLIDMERDGKPELLYSGKPYYGDDKDFFYLYVQVKDTWKEVYWDEGRLLAYKIHPNTEEVLLYHHRNPCCSQSSHNINRLRWINGGLKVQKKYFLANDQQMKGDFFPPYSIHNEKFYELKEEKMLLWSDSIISENAYVMAPTNEIIPFEKGAHYKVLYRMKKWRYVQFVSPPKLEQSRVVNSTNLQDVKVFGWLYFE
ncbi:MAG: hypothetical protein ACI9XP_000742 [Lentimonas sp.]|jgi:hypothetical protein